MVGMKLKGNVELFDIGFGALIGYCTFKATSNLPSSIVIGIVMVFAMSSFKISFGKKKKSNFQYFKFQHPNM